MTYKLIHGNCLDVMPTLADKSIDAVICDLPYGTTSCHWDSVIPFEPLWAQYKRIIKPRGAIVLFGSQPFTSALVMSNIEWFRYSWVWEKEQGTNFLDAHRKPYKVHEDINVFCECLPKYRPQYEAGLPYTNGKNRATDVYGSFHDTQELKTHGRLPKSVIKFNREVGYHPTQKPVSLIRYLLRTYTAEGETILDNTMGSGSTIVAAIQEGRNSIGIERDAEYFAIAQQRCLEATYQPSLFAPEPQQWQTSPMFGD